MHQGSLEVVSFETDLEFLSIRTPLTYLQHELHDSCSQILAESALALTTHIQVTMLIYHVFL